MPSELILALNGGSSSLKIAAFEASATGERLASVNIERIGSDDAGMTTRRGRGEPVQSKVSAQNHEAALEAAIKSLGEFVDLSELVGVGHRVVHGGPDYSSPETISPAMLDALRKLEPFDPEHLPAQVGLIELVAKRFPDVKQVACFDTAFHHDLPVVAKRLAVPRKFDALGVRRYGFHGISYAYLMEELKRVDPEAASGRVVLAHLGNGASLCAVREGKSMDTSMAFTPAAGIPMGTRSGDLDPGLLDYLSRAGGLSMDQINRMVHLESGLLGISETSSDMQRLLELEATDSRAGEAVAIFCYQVQKWIGAYAAALGGIETLIFAGGIGERAPEIRRRICANLGFLGIELDQGLNESNADVISNGPVKVRVIPTDEERMIAREIRHAIAAT